MKSKVKSVFIGLLMVLSIILFLLITGGISEGLNIVGFGRNSERLDTRQNLATLVSPHTMFINYGESDHALITRAEYESLFSEIPSIMEEIFDGSKNTYLSEDLVSDNIYNALLLQKSIIINFNQNIATSTLLNILGIENLNNLAEKYIEIDSIYVSLEKNFIIIRTNNSNYLITFNNLDTRKIENEVEVLKTRGYKPYMTIDEYFDNGKIGFIPDIENTKIEKISYLNLFDYLESQSVQNIISRFFKSDYNKIREIEGDGEILYLDGEKSLKISDFGIIEYTDNKKKKSTDRNLYLTLESFVEFLSINLGFDDAYFIDKIEPIEDGESVGYKIRLGKKEQNLSVISEETRPYFYIEAYVYNDYIKVFKETYRGTFSENFEYFKLEDDADIKSTILSNMGSIRARLGDQYISLDEIYNDLAWANIFYKDIPNEKYLKPYWKIQIRDEIFEFPIHTLED